MRNVRNFWIETVVDGRKTTMASGPRSRDGGFTQRVLIRNKGGVAMAAHLNGRPYTTPDGSDMLELEITTYQDGLPIETRSVRTKR